MRDPRPGETATGDEIRIDRGLTPQSMRAGPRHKIRRVRT